MQLQNLAEMESHPPSYGITDESFDALCTIGYAAPRPPVADLNALSIGELRQLVYARRLDDVGCIEKVHLIELLARYDTCPPCEPAEAEDGMAVHLSDALFDDERRKNLPQQCAICMTDFRESELLKVLPCSDLHAFHKECIQEWREAYRKKIIPRIHAWQPQATAHLKSYPAHVFVLRLRLVVCS